jgi:hypothetical protein
MPDNGYYDICYDILPANAVLLVRSDTARRRDRHGSSDAPIRPRSAWRAPRIVGVLLTHAAVTTLDRESAATHVLQVCASGINGLLLSGAH